MSNFAHKMDHPTGISGSECWNVLKLFFCSHQTTVAVRVGAGLAGT
jgi:hypothetical protein